jgi:hypothetical protein
MAQNLTQTIQQQCANAHGGLDAASVDPWWTMSLCPLVHGYIDNCRYTHMCLYIYIYYVYMCCVCIYIYTVYSRYPHSCTKKRLLPGSSDLGKMTPHQRGWKPCWWGFSFSCVIFPWLQWIQTSSGISRTVCILYVIQ